MAGFGEDEPWLAALDTEPGGVVVRVRLSVGMQRLDVLGAGIRLRSVQQRERDLRCAHSSILTSSPLTSR